MIEYYRVFLTFHVVAIISWMAGILYLYRLLVYASEAGRQNNAVFALLGTMSSRLYRYITFPSMVVSWIAGMTMVASQPAIGYSKWFLVKIVCVLALTHYTFYAGRLVTRYVATSEDLPSSKRLRILNEVPTVLMIVIVTMVIIKPF